MTHDEQDAAGGFDRPPSSASRERPVRRKPGRPRVDRATSVARRGLLDAAEELFAQGGFHATPASAIAARAGVTTGLVFYYFGTKEGLLEALIEERSFLPALRRLAATDEADTLERLLRDVGRALYRAANRTVPSVRIVVREALQREPLRERWEASLAGAAEALAQRLEPLRQGGDPPAAGVARTFLGAVAFEALFGREADADEIVEPIVRAMVRGFGGAGTPVP